MGGSQALNDIADFNQDVRRICSYCLEAVSTSDHIEWECKHFDPTRKEIDAALASVPHKWIRSCLKSGIAPAMKGNITRSFWGGEASSKEDAKARKLCGCKPERGVSVAMRSIINVFDVKIAAREIMQKFWTMKDKKTCRSRNGSETKFHRKTRTSTVTEASRIQEWGHTG